MYGVFEKCDEFWIEVFRGTYQECEDYIKNQSMGEFNIEDVD